MDIQHVFVSLTPEIEEVLADNAVDLAALLKERGFDVKLSRGIDPTASKEAASKEPALILVATAAVIVAATPIIRELIQNIARRPVLLKHRKLAPVEDSSGKPVTDSSGNPVLHWQETSELKEPASPPQPQQKAAISGMGISISFESRP